jgi:hypothetical protein
MGHPASDGSVEEPAVPFLVRQLASGTRLWNPAFRKEREGWGPGVLPLSEVPQNELLHEAQHGMHTFSLDLSPVGV